ncbi:hypothetical protein C5B42_01820 [Candidatus Cerribacteria bacterium 'Amazon FNV 2010 28 9']|uniref:DUF4190 domain-containing protein n=1 Tax=Candidatus Cerribacteria bacterium 'Amazon FNV 2010 28 9' TaxID=2081795 RepID=A0A317JRZ6_9BACT|nr:MAG: hypothetical protein C5B42_01820 [Candidatus Cerribacteria bacterium 'Amazon FNV 2010 28 9']
MKKLLSKIKRIFLPIFFLFLSLAPLSPASAQTADWSAQCGRYYNSKTNQFVDKPTVPNSDITQVATIQGVECLVSNVLATAITFIGFVAFIMFLIGGFKYLTAGNNSKGVEEAQKAITFAIIGIVVALTSILILRILSQLTGVSTFLNFHTQLPTPQP